jgi:O-antigen/teichoic acid export membrane protein
MLSYGKNLTVMSTLGVISSHLDKIILFHFLGAAQVAIYTFAIAIPEQLKSFIAKLSTLAFPKFSEKSKEEIRKTIWIKLLLMGIILFLISVVYIALAPIIFSVLFPLYTDSILLSQIFAASLFTLVINIPLDVLRALKKTKELYYFNISTAIVRITLAVILIYFYGLTGAIFSWIFYRVISLIYLLILLKKTLN